MGQPIDFVGLNTFIYDPSGWDIDQQINIELPNIGNILIPQPRESFPGDFGTIGGLEQNTLGGQVSSIITTVNYMPVLTSFGPDIALHKNDQFSLDLPGANDQEKTASLFVALNLRRNGPYGWPTWKQIRISENPLTRKQKRHSIFTYVEVPGMDIAYAGPFGSLLLPRSHSEIKKLNESALSSRYKPVRLFGSLEETITLSNVLSIYASLGNEMVYFDNYQPNRYFAVSEQESVYYQNLKKLYLNGRLQSPDSQLKSIYGLRYSESVYPSRLNIYRDYARNRPTFDFPWRDDIRVRMSPSTSQPDDFYYASAQSIPSIDNGFGFSVFYQNRWNLDSAWNFDSFAPESDSKYLTDGSTSNGNTSFDDYMRLSDTRKSLDSSSIYFPPIGGARSFGETLSSPYSRRQDELTNSAGGDGQLMNSYSLFADWRQVSNSSGYASSIDNFLTASAFYSRRHVIPSPKSVAHYAGMTIPETASYVENDLLFPIEQNFGGSTKWQAAATRRENLDLPPIVLGSPITLRNDPLVSRNPFYNSYSDFAEHTRLVGRDYAIVPEFKMSNHVEKYLNTSQLEASDLGVFEVSGGLEGTSSSETTEFYKTYSNSDFMRHFELIREDHAGFIDPTSISLKCKAIKKFVPYEGFFPSQRSMQLAKQFYSSYGDYFVNLQSEILVADDPTALTGEFAKAQIRIMGTQLYNYYVFETGTRARYYGGVGGVPRGTKASIADFEDETYGGAHQTDALACEYKSGFWGSSTNHPDGHWGSSIQSQHFYKHTNTNGTSTPEESNYGFILQDANRNCVYIQLIDSTVWDNLTDDHFYDGVIRNYMFPLAGYADSGSDRRQPLLIEDASLGFLNTAGWNMSWNFRIASSTAGTGHVAPERIPVIWIRADGISGHETANLNTAANIAAAVNSLNEAQHSDATPQGNLLKWFSRDSAVSWKQDWGYNDGNLFASVPGTSFPTTATQSWSVKAKALGPNPHTSGNQYDETYFVTFTDDSQTNRDEDQRVVLNYSNAISVSEVVQGDEVTLEGADAQPNHFGEWSLFNGNALSADKVIEMDSSDDPKYTRIQPMITPLFAPGVLFNTIKSGIACDYPIMTDNVNRVLATVSSSTESTSSFWMIGCRGSLTGAFVGATDFDYFLDNPSTNSGLLGGPDDSTDSNSYLGGSRFTTDTGALGKIKDSDGHNSYGVLALSRNLNANQHRGFNFRIPFEALIEPENYLANRAMVNQEPDNFLYFSKYLRMNYKAMWDGRGDTLYKKMAHNFLAEIPEFFLENGEFKSFKSLKQGDPNFGLVEEVPGGMGFADQTQDPLPMEYTMRVKLYRTTIGESKTIGSNGVQVQPPQDFDHFGAGGLKETLTMYSRPSAFGPPSWDGYTEMTGTTSFVGNDNRNGYNFPFTPPYYHGEAWADITFVPGRLGKHSLDEIIASSSVEYYRYWNPKSNLAMISRESNAFSTFQWTSWTGSLANPTSSIGEEDTSTYFGFTINKDGNWYGPQHPLFVNDNAMQIDASLNLFGKQEVRHQFEESDDPNVTIVDQNETQWAIQTKFETPILNFAHISASGQQQIVEIDTANLYANRDDIDTDGVTLSVKFPQGFFNVSEPYVDNRITIYDGATPYNLWFYSPETYSPTKTLPFVGTQTSIYPETFNSVDPNTEGHPNTVKIDLSTLGSDLGIRNKIVNVLNATTPFSANADPSDDSKLYITASLFGSSTAPSMTTTLKAVTGLIEPVVLTTGSYDTGSLHHNPVSPSATTRGMWHQYGLIPRSSEGVYMELADIPSSWKKGALGVHGGLQAHTGSLVDLVGFSRNKKKLGIVAEAKYVQEAVVAVPFIIKNGERKFFEIPRSDIEDAIAPKDSESIAGASVRSMVRKMKKYVFPRQFDFINRPAMIPFAMYIFEFDHTFNRQDLSDMWQGISPQIGQSFEVATDTISHNLLSSELLGGGSNPNSAPTRANRNKNPGLKLNDRVRWMVFKVKQRARANYYDKVIKKPNMTDLAEAQNQGITYNWPYDFFSLVELVKIESDIMFSKVEEVDDEGSTQVEPPTSSPVITGKLVNPNISKTLANSNAFRPGSVSGFMNNDDEEGI